MNIAEPDRRHDTRCIYCEHPISGCSPRSVAEAMAEHARHVIATKNPAEDAHFEDARLSALVMQ